MAVGPELGARRRVGLFGHLDHDLRTGAPAISSSIRTRRISWKPRRDQRIRREPGLRTSHAYVAPRHACCRDANRLIRRVLSREPPGTYHSEYGSKYRV